MCYLLLQCNVRALDATWIVYFAHNLCSNSVWCIWFSCSTGHQQRTSEDTGFRVAERSLCLCRGGIQTGPGRPWGLQSETTVWPTRLFCPLISIRWILIAGNVYCASEFKVCVSSYTVVSKLYTLWSKGSLSPTSQQKSFSNVSTDCFSLCQGKGRKGEETSSLYWHTLYANRELCSHLCRCKLISYWHQLIQSVQNTIVLVACGWVTQCECPPPLPPPLLPQRTKGQRYRFSLLIQELQTAETDEYAACVLAFINCLLAGCNDLSRRVKMRNELIGMFLHLFRWMHLLWRWHAPFSLCVCV